MSSGIAELDALLGGGIEAGSSTLMLGPAGTGKSLIADLRRAQPSRAARRRRCSSSTRSSGFCLDRAKGMGFDLEAHAATAAICFIEQVDAAELSPGEFAHRVRERVDRRRHKTVVIDSLNGYQAAMPEENSLILHIHELLQYLNRQGVDDLPDRRAARACRRHEGAGRRHLSRRHRHPAALFRGAGPVRRAISVIKKRTGAHEDTIREFRIDIAD